MKLRFKHHFDAAHRLSNHKGKCKNLHGHRWEMEVIISGHVDAVSGMIMDFGEIKGFIDGFFDHSTILYGNKENVPLIDLLHTMGCKVYILHDEPTAENLVMEIRTELKNLLPEHTVTVRLWESSGAMIEYGN